MGIVNVTPDSFSDGGQFDTVEGAVAHGLMLAEEGADILDIGGESTRPGAEPVSEEEELSRILPVIEKLSRQTNASLSIDTRKPGVARAAVDAGATVWNDVSALTFEDNSVAIAAELACDIVLMHAQGAPQTMQDSPHYVDVVAEVKAFLAARIEVCVAAGVDRQRLIVDPGIGFGKSTAHNLQLLAHLDELSALDCPIMLGASRKRFIAAIDRDSAAATRLGGSLAAALAGVGKGASILRVHDVAATRQALAVSKAIETAV